MHLTQIYKANIDILKREIDSNKLGDDFNTLISIMTRNPNRRSKRTSENILTQVKKNLQHNKIYGMQQKHFYEGIL